ncbi:interferon-induced, double-stranded RNA-activated protein kinase-like isoform X2 [Plectropomus leopardus]|uniref:interferon-induced, double-stranded RNA-activated protein kinase-like isoform X2 n=1 Tax=Plectropomus leopardus TaxID=160734 RepID=UPI001C4CDDE2|nr:interferon-induced, double-stranded RNA-activated protein kinase-like isoform X2 [Plectropomus leopardus]
METVNYTFELNEYALITRSELKYEDVGGVGPGLTKIFTQRVVLNGEVYPEGVGKTKKEAKYNAAKNALKCLLENEPPESVHTTVDENNQTSGHQTEEPNLDISDICDRIRNLKVNAQLYRDNRKKRQTNYIGFVSHYCQKTNRCHTYIEERRCGPSHNLKKEYPVGEGKTVKEAKQEAARLAWVALQEQSDWDSKVSVRSTVSEDGAQSMMSELSITREPLNPSPQRPSVNTFTDSSVPSNAQMPLRSAASEDDPPTELSTPTSLESIASSQSMSTSKSGSGIFSDSSNSSKDQDIVKNRNAGNSQSETFDQLRVNLSKFTSNFDSIKRLGSGGFGRVYKARDKQLDKYYAVKIVRSEEKSLREVGTLSDLHHRNIVRYYTFWTDDIGYPWDNSADSKSSSQPTDNSSVKYLYIQMELCDTKTLKKWIKKKNELPVQDSKRREESLRIAQQIVSGVEYIHTENHIHRDLKPENILFGLKGEVKIGDFGLVTRDDDDDSALMERTENEGTTSYMAPEQTGRTNGRKVDIFAVGLIYFELLWKLSTGHERGRIWDDARSQKLPEEFSLTFPQENQMIKPMLCARPQDRPEARQLRTELETWAQTFSVPNVPQENAAVGNNEQS